MGESVSVWQEAVGGSATSLAGDLGLGDLSTGAISEGVPSNIAGAHVPLVGDEVSAQLGFLSNGAGAEKLARKMLCLEDDDELSEEDVADAVCEMANMLAGLVKRKLASHFSDLRIGLPLYVTGKVRLPAGAESYTQEASVDGIPVYLVVVAPALAKQAAA